MKTNCDKQLLGFAEYPQKLFPLVHPQTNPELNLLTYLFTDSTNINIQ